MIFVSLYEIAFNGTGITIFDPDAVAAAFLNAIMPYLAGRGGVFKEDTFTMTIIDGIVLDGTRR